MTASQAQTTHAVRHPRLQVDYVDQTDPGVLLADPQVLAVFGFGDAAPRLHDPRYLRVPLQPYQPACWKCGAPLRRCAAAARAISPGPATVICILA